MFHDTQASSFSVIMLTNNQKTSLLEGVNSRISALCMYVCVVMCSPPHQVVLCKSLRDTSSRLAELGWLHNKVRKYTDARSLDRAFGLVGQVCLWL